MNSENIIDIMKEKIQELKMQVVPEENLKI